MSRHEHSPLCVCGVWAVGVVGDGVLGVHGDPNMSSEYCGIEECNCPDPDDERERRLDRMLNTAHVARLVTHALREDRVTELTGYDISGAFIKPDDSPFPIARFPEQAVDTQKLMEFLAELVCPPPCVGFVNETGWHQLCEQKAHDAILALGLTPPAVTPIPGADQ